MSLTGPANTPARPEMPFFLWLRLITGQKLLEVHRRHLGAQQRDAGREVSLCHGPLPEVSSQCWRRSCWGGSRRPATRRCGPSSRPSWKKSSTAMEPIDREILTLRHFEELSNGEVAQVLNMTKTAASNRYIRALKRLKDLLSAERPAFSATLPICR